MDPVTLATITSAASVLASEVAKGDAGRDLWAKVKSVLGWKSEPKPEELAVELAKALQDDKALAGKIVELLQSDEAHGSSASALVEKIDAKNVTVIGHVTTLNLAMS